MKMLYFFGFVFFTLNVLIAQNNVVGIGTNTPKTKLDVVGDLALREGTAIAVSGPSPTVTVTLSATASENSYYRITGTPSGTMTLNSIANGVDGQIITLVNATSIKLKMTNNNATGGILTAGALAQFISPNGSVTLQYSATANRWFITNNSGSNLTDWIKAATTDETAISSDNQYVTGNIGLGGHTGGASDNSYNFVNNNPAVPLVVVSPGIATPTSSPTTTGIRLAQPGTNGTKWPLSADFKLGSYATSGVSAQSQLDIALGNGGTSTPDVNVMSILGNGNVGIGNSAPDAPLTIGDGFNSSAYVRIYRNNDPHIQFIEGTDIATSSTARIQGNVVSTHPQLQITNSSGATSWFNVNHDDGNVGIGTTTPVRRLEVNDVMKFTNASADANDGVIGTKPFAPGLNIVGINTDATYRKIAMWGGINQKQNDLGNYFLNNNYFQGTGNIYIGNTSAGSNPYILPQNPIGGSNPTYLRLGSSSNKLQDLYSNNAYIDKVRIGSTSATNYPLEVSGTISWTGSARTYSHPEGGTWSGYGSTTRDISIYSNGSILVTDGSRFVAASDKRIKKNIKISNSAEDLSLLNKIEISDYNLKDSLFSSRESQKKVIAQQIEQIFPQAITKSISTIPNIYAEAKCVKLSNIEADFKMQIEHGLKVGDKVRVYNVNGELSMVEVISCADKMNFTAILENPKSGNYFIYGVEVDDFLSVDYDALAMLNISATQELYKKIIALEKENTDLKTTLSNKVDKADVLQLKVQIDELKKLILNTGLKAEK